MEGESAAVGRLRQQLGPALREYIRFRDEETVVVAPERTLDALRLLRDDPDIGLHFLADLAGLDRLGLDSRAEERFAVVYHLLSLSTMQRLRVRVHLPEQNPHVASATALWPAANWLEREVYDLYGIHFDGHPDLRRLLMPDDYDGHPLRKDYPLHGRGERMELQMVAGAPPYFGRGSAAAGRPGEAHGGPYPPMEPAREAFLAGDEASLMADEDQLDRLEEFRRGRVSFTEVEHLPTQTMLLNFGPQHPAMHGTLRAIVELDGERVVRAAAEMGYLHSGFEKLAENRHYNDFITITDRMNYMSPLANNFGYAMAVEKLLGIEIPPRARYIRVILAEMARISDHLLSMGAMALDIGAFTAFLYAWRERETLYDIFEAICGARFTVSYARVGGLANDVPADFADMTRGFLRNMPHAISDFTSLLDRNRIWIDRTRGVGVITPQDAIAYGVSGPALRASGIAHDLRQAEPYSSYEDFDFEIPVGENGDCYDRYLVRIEEIRQSCRIIEQAVSRLPDGPVVSDDERVVLPAKDKVYGSIEGLIYHFKNIMDGHGFCPPRGEAYGASEAPNGELGFYVVSDGGRNPYRVRVRPPSLLHFQIYPKILEGRLLSDSVAILASLNVIAGELDR